MSTEGHASNLAESALTHEIIGASFVVLNEVGHGLHEKPYEKALPIELNLRKLACAQQPRFDVMFKGVQVGEFIPDLIVGGKVIVDAKVIPKITDVERGQMLNYLRITHLHVGLIINFHKPKLEWERIVL